MNGIVEVLSVHKSPMLQVEQALMVDLMPMLATVTQGLHQVYYMFTLNGTLQSYLLAILFMYYILKSICSLKMDVN